MIVFIVCELRTEVVSVSSQTEGVNIRFAFQQVTRACCANSNNIYKNVLMTSDSGM